MTWASVMHQVRDPVNLQRRYGANTWAVISGADSLGQEFGRQLAKKGFNVYFIDHDAERLQAAVDAVKD
jgi:short-subunit dehydrogenase